MVTEYNIIIFISENCLSSIDVNTIYDNIYDVDIDVYDDGICKESLIGKISLDGNDIFKYSNTKDIENFCKKVKENYNIDSFSDIDISIKIIAFGKCQSSANILFEQVKGSMSVNVIDAKTLLPLLLINELTIQNVVLQQEMTYNIVSFGVSYCIETDNWWHFFCYESENENSTNENEIIIDIEKYAFLYICNYKNLLLNANYNDLWNRFTIYKEKIREHESQLKQEEEKKVVKQESLKKVIRQDDKLFPPSDIY